MSYLRYVPDLDNYRSSPETKSCYLDGRYFNMVFKDYPGLLIHPLTVIIRKNKHTGQFRVHTHMNRAPIDNRYPGILRVVVDSPTSRHSSLIIINYAGKTVHRFDPHGKNSPFYAEVNRAIEEYLELFIDFTYIYDLQDTPIYDEKNPACSRKQLTSGFCVAYVTKYAYDYLNERPFDPYYILNFAGAVEKMYGPLSEVGKDVEYGYSDQDRNTAVGAIGGAGIGALAIGGPIGLLGGALAGGVIGHNW